MSYLKPYPVLLGLAILFIFARPAHAFGAGNIASISKIEGQNWRHGDLEDTLLTIAMARLAGGKKFDKLNVSRVYFGNWLRDYSQAIDVGTVKSVSAEAIRLLLCVLGFLTFGYGSREFEVTAERLGCYRPEDHIDNPKNYADNEDATQYDRRLRGPVDERVELAIDEQTGMKNYIANEQVGIMTSAKHVRNLFRKSIELARSYKNSRNKAELHEALRLLGTGLHCLEDFLAHSNYTELALIELGERDVFPHVGRDTLMRIPGAREEVYPIVTGTFGGVDFLHSVTGEMSDKMTQSEIEDLEGTLQKNSRNDTSIIEGLLDKIPDGIIGGSGEKKEKMHEIQDNASSAQMEQTRISPREPEEFTRQIQDIFRQIMPAIEFHDELFMNISEAFDKIPILPQIIEQLEEQMSMWVFSIMAPFVVPVLQQVKNELRTGSSEIIQSSQAEQHIVFNDDRCTDPTHSMLSKDHFTNILNEPAGKTASQVVAWVVPQIMEAWDDEGVDIRRLNDRIVAGVMHHPAQRQEGNDGAEEGRQIMFRSVQEWWESMSDDGRDEYRRKLSREGVERGENHREGQHDTGHGCCAPLSMHKNFAKGGTFEDRIAAAAAGAIVEGVSGGVSDLVNQASGGQVKIPEYKNQSSGGLGSFLSGGGDGESGGGGFLGKVAGSLLGGAFGNDEKESHSSTRRDDDGSVTESRQEYGHSGNTYAQAQYSQTHHAGGGESSEYRRSEQQSDGYGGYSTEQRTETHSSYGGGYEQRSETRYESSQQSSSYGGRRDDDDSYGRRQEQSYGSRRDDDDGSYGRRQEQSYGSRRDDDDSSYGRRHGESDSYGRQQEYGGGGDSYGSRRQEYGGGSDSYGGSRQEYGGGNDSYGGSRQEYGRSGEDSYGSSRQEYGRGGDDSYGSSGRQEYGGDSSYGERREEYGRRGDDDNEDNEYGRRRGGGW